MKIYLIFALFLSPTLALAEISEQREDLVSIQCSGNQFSFSGDSKKIKGTATDLSGQKFSIDGLVSTVNIDTKDSSVNLLVTLSDSSSGARYMVTKILMDDNALVDLHADFSHGLGTLGKGTCSLNFK